MRVMREIKPLSGRPIKPAWRVLPDKAKIMPKSAYLANHRPGFFV